MKTRETRESWYSRKTDRVRRWRIMTPTCSTTCTTESHPFVCLEYAQVTRMLGNGRLEAMCFDGSKRLCHIRGKLRKKVDFL